MDCKHSVSEYDYNSEGIEFEHCDILLERCPMIRRCGLNGKNINIDNYDKKCNTYIMGELKMDMYRVAYEKGGYLYILPKKEEESTIVLKNTISGEVPTYVKLKKVKGIYTLTEER